MIIAQITDLHIEAAGHRPAHGFDVNASLAAVLRRLESHTPRPDMILATGDLTAHGDDSEYDALAALLNSVDIPMYIMPGNHDDRDGMRKAFPGHTYLPKGDYLHYVIDEFPLRIIALDTLAPGLVDGTMCPARCDWLTARLAEAPSRPTVIAMHHPPADIGIGWLHSGNFAGRDEIRDIIAVHQQVQAVLCGHVHRSAQVPLAHTRVHTTGSTAYQFLLELSDDAPRGKGNEAPAYGLHLWQPENGLVSHTVTLATSDGG